MTACVLQAICLHCRRNAGEAGAVHGPADSAQGRRRDHPAAQDPRCRAWSLGRGRAQGDPQAGVAAGSGGGGFLGSGRGGYANKPARCRATAPTSSGRCGMSVEREDRGRCQCRREMGDCRGAQRLGRSLDGSADDRAGLAADRVRQRIAPPGANGRSSSGYGGRQGCGAPYRAGSARVSRATSGGRDQVVSQFEIYLRTIRINLRAAYSAAIERVDEPIAYAHAQSAWPRFISVTKSSEKAENVV